MRLGSWRAALPAAIAELGAGELVAAVLRGAGSPVTGVGQTMIDLLPGPGVDIVVATAETKDKALLRANVAGATLGLARVAAGLEAQRSGRGQAVLIAHGMVGGGAAAASAENASIPSLLAGLAGGMAGAGALALLRRARRRREIAAERLTFGAGALALAAAGALQRRRRAAANLRRAKIALPAAASPAPRPPANAELPIPGVTPLYTPNRSFYVTDVVVSPPAIDPAGWRLRVHGLVERELELSLGQLLGMPLVELDATLVCVHNPVGGDRVGSARWLGLPLHTLLEAAGVRPGCDQILARSIGGFTAGLPLGRAWEKPVPLVALAMNGEPLPIQHGFPARLLTPGLWGADANPKWLTEIELTSWERASDYWDARGWPRAPGRVKPGSRIDVPAQRSILVSGSALAAGVAWGPSRGVTGVEVSVDGGEWRPATLSPSVSPLLWRQWALTLRAGPGPHELRVRAVCGEEVQSGESAPPYPRGSSGYHTVRVTVVESGALPSPLRDRLVRKRIDLARRGELAAMAPPAWRANGFPRRPAFEEVQPPAQRGLRVLMAGRTLARRAR